MYTPMPREAPVTMAVRAFMPHTPFGRFQDCLAKDNRVTRQSSRKTYSAADGACRSAALRRGAGGAGPGDRATRAARPLAAGLGRLEHAGRVGAADADRPRDSALDRPDGDGLPARRARRPRPGRTSPKPERPALLLIHLTPEGRKIQRKAAGELAGQTEMLLKPLDAAERRQLVDLLGRIAGHWRELHD